MKTLWAITRAIVNAPETLHWIRKYEAAKKENAELRERIAVMERDLAETDGAWRFNPERLRWEHVGARVNGKKR